MKYIFNLRRKLYMSKKAWQEKVIGYMIDFGGGWREEDSWKTKWDKAGEVCGVGELVGYGNFAVTHTQHIEDKVC